MDKVIKVIFDGGCSSNGSPDCWGYGSFSVDGAAPIRLEFGLGNPMSNNVAEFRSAIEALKYLAIPGCGYQKVLLIGDSQLAINCLAGRWKTKAPHLKPLKEQFLELAGKFASVEFKWHPREKSVAVLGH